MVSGPCPVSTQCLREHPVSYAAYPAGGVETFANNAGQVAGSYGDQDTLYRRSPMIATNGHSIPGHAQKVDGVMEGILCGM